MRFRSRSYGLSGIVRTSVPPLLDEALNGISFGTEIPLPAPIDQTYGFDIAPADANMLGRSMRAYRLALDSQVYSVSEASTSQGDQAQITRLMMPPIFRRSTVPVSLFLKTPSISYSGRSGELAHSSLKISLPHTA